jgi:hypothetical protein
LVIGFAKRAARPAAKDGGFQGFFANLERN